MILALELADAGLLALAEEGEPAPPSPGIAIVDGTSVVTGREAAARARLTPRRVHDRFWIEISDETLGPPWNGPLRSADLAWHQLAELWKTAGRGVDSVILAVPGSLESERLGLILGVARSAGLPVDGMVDAATAALVGRAADGPVVHLDLELHRTVLTLVRPGPARSHLRVLDTVGLVRLREAWMRLVARTFLAATRYDPFHSAPGEQGLADRLEGILDELRSRSRATVSLAAGDKAFTIELERSMLIDAAGEAIDRIEALVRTALPFEPAALTLSARAATVPGLADRLGEATGLEPESLPLAAPAAGALARAGRIRTPGSSLPLVTDLGEPG